LEKRLVLFSILLFPPEKRTVAEKLTSGQLAVLDPVGLVGGGA